jgi:hypothetical protein
LEIVLLNEAACRLVDCRLRSTFEP